ncbi:signal peptidase I [Candidatus Solirubrobacter pratensis]|uniref:signal peptidase I n=1 Tax=Candidatus Solirubrobacter pratensis TaxID=1298857 RepID=UPI00041BF039|nr:signal peptidase I [Candidatus Solirubrobacter pratensis]
MLSRRVAPGWILTIVGVIAAVLALDTWIVSPYRVSSASMEPTLHCARDTPNCLAGSSDGVLANRIVYHFRSPRRGDVVVVRLPPAAERRCGSAGTVVKRLIGLPGETVSERNGFVSIDGRPLDEPYIDLFRRDHEPPRAWDVPRGEYFFMGDNRADSCDSRLVGSIPRKRIVGEAVAIYWPPHRIGFL